MSFDQIKDIFSISNVDSLLMRLAIECPVLSTKQVIEIFKISLDEYSSQNDQIMNPMTWIFSSNILNSNLSKQKSSKSKQTYHTIDDPKCNYFTTKIFKNLYYIINETDIWDEHIEKKSFIIGMEHIKDGILKKLRKNYANQILQDKLDIIYEFIDLIKQKQKAFLIKGEKQND